MNSTGTSLSGSFISPFRSYFMGGFESAYHINCYGRRVDMIQSTKHDLYARQDYAKARQIGILTVRDAMRWYLIDRGSRYDFASFLPMLKASLLENVQVLWTLCHYGWPDDLDLFSGRFVDRFKRYAREMARVLVDHGVEAPLIIPFNEISYFCHAVCTEGDMYPYALGRGWELKRQIVRATIEGTDAVRSVAPRARFVHVDPIIHVVPPVDRPEFAAEAAARERGQYEAAEMIAGRVAPELGGREDYLDLVGVNFYHANQWEHPGDKTIFWHHKPRDPRWKPLHELLRDAERVYQRPIFIAETSHVGIGRPEWIRETLGEVQKALNAGVSVYGVCLYPLIDRHCWVRPTHWHNSGIWDIDQRNGHQRVLSEKYYSAFVEMRNAYTWGAAATHVVHQSSEQHYDEALGTCVNGSVTRTAPAAGNSSDSFPRAVSIADDM